MTREEAKLLLIRPIVSSNVVSETKAREIEAYNMAIEALSAEAVPQSEQYKKGFEDAKRAFLVEYARESENMRKRNAQLEVMLNAQKAISAEAVQGEWVRKYDDKVNCYWYECDQCGEYRPRNQFGHEYNANFCPNCGAKMHKGGDSECL